MSTMNGEFYAPPVALSKVRMILQFHKMFEVPIGAHPKLLDDIARRRRETLIEEELNELKEASAADNLVGIADALGDLLYVVYGAAIEYGIPIDEVFEEIHRSNMTKLWPDGTVHKREDGKVLKPPTYSPADLQGIINWNGRH